MWTEYHLQSNIKIVSGFFIQYNTADKLLSRQMCAFAAAISATACPFFGEDKSSSHQ